MTNATASLVRNSSRRAKSKSFRTIDNSRWKQLFTPPEISFQNALGQKSILQSTSIFIIPTTHLDSCILDHSCRNKSCICHSYAKYPGYGTPAFPIGIRHLLSFPPLLSSTPQPFWEARWPAPGAFMSFSQRFHDVSTGFSSAPSGSPNHSANF